MIIKKGVILIFQLEERIKKWLILIYIFILTVIVAVLLIILVGILPSEAGISNEVYAAIFGGIIGAIGAIIGGGITFYGVLITIRNTRFNDVLDKYPDRIMASERILNFVVEFERKIEDCFNPGSYGYYIQDFEKLLTAIEDQYLPRIDEYKKDAALIGREAFRLMKNIQLTMEIYGDKYHNDIIRELEHYKYDWNPDTYREWISIFNDDLDLIKDQIEKLDKEYEKLTEIITNK